MNNYSIEQGLPENTVLDIVEDEIGFLWIASPNFLTRFDGDNFKVFRKSFDFQVNDSAFNLGKLYVEGDKLWMITKGGKLEYMDLLTEKSHPLKYFKDGEREIVKLTSIFIDQNRIYLGTDDRGLFITDLDLKLISHYDECTKQNLSSNRVNHIFKNKEDGLWVLTDKGVNQIKLGVVSQYLLDINFTHGIENSAGVDLSSISAGIWTQKYSDDSIYQEYSAFSDLKNFLTELHVFQIFYERKFSTYQWGIWLATLGEGLMVIDEMNNHAFQVKLEKNPKDVYCIYGAKNGKIWVGTRKNGLYSLDPSIPLVTTNWPEEIRFDGKLQLKTSGDQSSIYIPQNDEILIYDQELTPKGIFGRYDFFKEADEPEINSIVPIQGGDRFFINSLKNGSLVFDPVNQVSHPLQKSSDEFIRNHDLSHESTLIYESKAFPGSILFGNKLGLFKLDLIRQEFFQVVDYSVSQFCSINENEAAIYFSNGSIGFYDFSEGRLEQKDFLTKVIPIDLDIQSMNYQNNWLWLGSLGNGLILVNLENGKVVNVTSEDGLPNDFIMGMEFEDTRTVWCSTHNGFFKLNFIKSNSEIGIEEILYLNHKNGILINEFLPGLSYKRKDGKICFSSEKGILCLEGENYSWDDYQSKILISDIKVNSQQVESSIGLIHYMDELELSSKENSLEFFFSAISKNVPDNLHYSYQLEGYDENWVQARNRRYASYTNLDPGTYLFKIKLTNDNFEGAPIKTLPVIIHASFWQTTWFKVLVVLTIISIFYWYYRMKIKHLLSLQRVKEEISADLHDDIGARLTTIQLISAIHKNKFQGQPEIEMMLSNIDQEIHDSSEALHELVGNIKMKEDDLGEYFSRLRRYISESLDQTTISYQIAMPDSTSQATLSLSKRKDIYLILKELINNVRKHSEARKVEVKVFYEQRSLNIHVRDDGIGFNPDSSSERNGMNILRYRVEKYNGSITLESSPSKGTEVKISIALDKNLILKDFWSNGLQKIASFWAFN
ncbi:sensor histidine kinase [Algoriphagus limi]|uniref:histidine kinase n=1 Tax=Algoriphagus limi TaxID=2975273 RepID=A0ABT2G4I9_9BACT|nr:sensor histidine kinase [Algoriphagus limi]MCS5490179.1 ATP-binding protein [Algoriphagus limi]